MKVYLKILFIAAAMQIAGVCFTWFAGGLLQKSGKSTAVAILIGIGLLVLSMILSLILAIRWCRTKRGAFFTYVLLPTNYTWLAAVMLVIGFVRDLLDILESCPPNFG